MQILVIEDDPEMAANTVRILTEAGWTVEHAEDGRTGLQMAAARSFDLLVVDRMLPKLDGISVLRRLREIDVTTPALILSALGEPSDKVDGLESGADDYLAKPFAADELVARLRALSRRSQANAHPEVILIEDLEIWLKSKSAVRGGKPLDLTDSEFRLLHYFAQHQGDLITRNMILEHVFNWRPGLDPGTTVVEVAISRLRSKLDKDFDPPLLTTVRRRGYVFNAAARSS
ncbi:MAG: response regulator transcription factor [Pseudomonadota bacterium]